MTALMRWRTRRAVAGRSCQTFRSVSTTSALVTSETGSSTAKQLAPAVQSVVEVDQFYGIEIGEFPARIAGSWKTGRCT